MLDEELWSIQFVSGIELYMSRSSVAAFPNCLKLGRTTDGKNGMRLSGC
jgi:hypothetical protein